MSDKTGISWTDATWNPIRGCSRVSEGCRHCYAETMAGRFCGPGQPYEGLAIRKLKVISDDEQRTEARWTGEVRMVPEHLADPIRWKKPRRVFVNSMSDLFHEKLTNEQIAAVFGVMAAAPHHTFQVLTKRARRMRQWFAWLTEQAGQARDAAVVHYEDTRDVEVRLCVAWMDTHHVDRKHVAYPAWPLPNVWLGVSVENQDAADERIPDLLATPAAVRFLSCEPLIGPVDLGWFLGRELSNQHGDPLPTTNLDWIIAGCESGPGARACNVEWLRKLRDQCTADGTSFFLKQATSASEGGHALYPSKFAARSEVRLVVASGAGSSMKPGGVIELPYLDGQQHIAFPATSPVRCPTQKRGEE